MAARGQLQCHVSTEQTLERDPNLTPSDFRTVRERFFFLGKERGIDNVCFLSALEVEAAAKKGNRAPIGFMS